MGKSVRIQVVLFDFGGVIAEEGFREGLRALAQKHHLDEAVFIKTVYEIIYASGYLLGKSTESAFWATARNITGIQGNDADLRNECLSRFIIRDWMLKIVHRLRAGGIVTGILSDQTDWLDALNERDNFFHCFDHVFNSYHLGESKKNPGIFTAVADNLGIPPQSMLFIDDDSGNCERARQRGLHAIQYVEKQDFLNRFHVYCPWVIATATKAGRRENDKTFR